MGRFYLFEGTGFRLDLSFGVIRKHSPMGFQTLVDSHDVTPEDCKQEVTEQAAKAKKTKVDRSEEFAAFLTSDAESNPSEMIPLTESRLAKAKRLVKGVRIE
ncbi:hypothetical protein ACKFKF_11390 [Phormidesmis sp. 146-12]